MESWKQRINSQNHNRPYGRYKPNAPCRKHPKHTQSPGVCSICLNEKLSRLNKSGTKRRVVPSSSSLSSLSSTDCSSCSSPVVGSSKGLKKSWSVVFFLQRRRDEDENVGKKIEVKRGFWSKLVPRRIKALNLMHSGSLRERFVEPVH